MDPEIYNIIEAEKDRSHGCSTAFAGLHKEAPRIFMDFQILMLHVCNLSVFTAGRLFESSLIFVDMIPKPI